MEVLSSTEHLCYVCCNFCGTILAVGIPCTRLLETITVKCGHCSNLSCLSTKPLVQPATAAAALLLPASPNNSSNDQLNLHMALKPSPPPMSGVLPPSPSSLASLLSPSTNIDQQKVVPKVHHVVKPPEKKHRLPSAYNRFMKEEIHRIKAANPQITHREAFSTAAKNWAKFDHPVLRDSASAKKQQISSNTNHYEISGALM